MRLYYRAWTLWHALTATRSAPCNRDRAVMAYLASNDVCRNQRKIKAYRAPNACNLAKRTQIVPRNQYIAPTLRGGLYNRSILKHPKRKVMPGHDSPEAERSEGEAVHGRRR